MGRGNLSLQGIHFLEQDNGLPEGSLIKDLSKQRDLSSEIEEQDHMHELQEKGILLQESDPLFLECREIFDRFAVHYPLLKEVQLVVLQSDIPHAYFAEHRSAIVLSTELLRQLKGASDTLSKDIVAAVLAHESIHAVRYIEKNKKRSTIEVLKHEALGHAEEHEADRRGMKLCAESGYNPRAMILLMNTLQDDFDSIFTGSHPSFHERINHLTKDLESRTSVITNVNKEFSYFSPQALRVTSSEALHDVYKNDYEKVMAPHAELESIMEPKSIYDLMALKNLYNFKLTAEKVYEILHATTEDQEILTTRRLYKEFFRKRCILYHLCGSINGIGNVAIPTLFSSEPELPMFDYHSDECLNRFAVGTAHEAYKAGNMTYIDNAVRRSLPASELLRIQEDLRSEIDIMNRAFFKDAPFSPYAAPSTLLHAKDGLKELSKAKLEALWKDQETLPEDRKNLTISYYETLLQLYESEEVLPNYLLLPVIYPKDVEADVLFDRLCTSYALFRETKRDTERYELTTSFQFVHVLGNVTGLQDADLQKFVEFIENPSLETASALDFKNHIRTYSQALYHFDRFETVAGRLPGGHLGECGKAYKVHIHGMGKSQASIFSKRLSGQSFEEQNPATAKSILVLAFLLERGTDKVREYKTEANKDITRTLPSDLLGKVEDIQVSLEELLCLRPIGGRLVEELITKKAIADGFAIGFEDDSMTPALLMELTVLQDKWEGNNLPPGGVLDFINTKASLEAFLDSAFFSPLIKAKLLIGGIGYSMVNDLESVRLCYDFFTSLQLTKDADAPYLNKWNDLKKEMCRIHLSERNKELSEERSEIFEKRHRINFLSIFAQNKEEAEKKSTDLEEELNRRESQLQARINSRMDIVDTVNQLQSEGIVQHVLHIAELPDLLNGSLEHIIPAIEQNTATPYFSIKEGILIYSLYKKYLVNDVPFFSQNANGYKEEAYFSGFGEMHVDFLFAIEQEIARSGHSMFEWVTMNFHPSEDRTLLIARLLERQEAIQEEELIQFTSELQYIDIDSAKHLYIPEVYRAASYADPHQISVETINAAFALPKDANTIDFIEDLEELHTPSFEEFKNYFSRSHPWLLRPKALQARNADTGNTPNTLRSFKNSVYSRQDRSLNEVYGSPVQHLSFQVLLRIYEKVCTIKEHDVRITTLLSEFPYKTIVRDTILTSLFRKLAQDKEISQKQKFVISTRIEAEIFEEKSALPIRKYLVNLELELYPDHFRPTEKGIARGNALFTSASVFRNDLYERIYSLNQATETSLLKTQSQHLLTPEYEDAEGENFQNHSLINLIFSGSDVVYIEGYRLNTSLLYDRKVLNLLQEKVADHSDKMLLYFLQLLPPEERKTFWRDMEVETFSDWSSASELYLLLSATERRDFHERLLMGPKGILTHKEDEKFSTFLEIFSQHIFASSEQHSELFRKIFCSIIRSSDIYKGTNILCDIIEYGVKKKQKNEVASSEEIVSILLSSIGIVGKKVAQSLSENSAVPLSYRSELKKSQDKVDVLPISSIYEILYQQGLTTPDSGVQVLEIGPLLGAASNKQVHMLTVQFNNPDLLQEYNKHCRKTHQKELVLGERTNIVGKVKRPELNNDKLLEEDIRLFKEILSTLSEEGYGALFSEGFVEEVKLIIEQELDFSTEASFSKVLAKDLEQITTYKGFRMRCPRVIFQSTDCILESIAKGVSLGSLIESYRTSDKIGKDILKVLHSGGSFEDLLIEGGADTAKTIAVTRELVSLLFIYQTFFTGNVHVDLHPGNILVDSDNNEVNIIDLGMSEIIEKRKISHLRELFLGLSFGNAKRVARSLEKLGWVDHLKVEFKRNLVSARTKAGKNSVSESALFKENIDYLLALSNKSSNRPPKEVFLVLFGLSKIAGYLEHLDASQMKDIFFGLSKTLIRKKIKSLVSTQFSGLKP